MKNHIVVLSAFCIAAAPALAAAQVGLGVKGGLSYGNVSNSGLLPGNAGQRSGFALGAGLTVGGTVGFGAELLYAQRGVTSSTSGASRRLNYIDIPAYLRVALPTPGISPFAYAGPQVSFEMNCEAGGGTCPNSGRPKTTFDGVIGGGLRFGRGLSLDARYLYGLNDLKLNTLTTSQSYRTRSFMILMGIGF